MTGIVRREPKCSACSHNCIWNSYNKSISFCDHKDETPKIYMSTQIFQDIFIRVNRYMPHLVPLFVSEYLQTGSTSLGEPREPEMEIGIIRMPQSQHLGKYLKFLTSRRLKQQSMEMERNLEACDPAEFTETLAQTVAALSEMLIRNEASMHSGLYRPLGPDWYRIRGILTPKKEYQP